LFGVVPGGLAKIVVSVESAASAFREMCAVVASVVLPMTALS